MYIPPHHPHPKPEQQAPCCEPNLDAGERARQCLPSMAGVVELHVVIAQGADAPVLDAARKSTLTMDTAPRGSSLQGQYRASRNGLPQPRDMRGATQGQARESAP